MNVEHIRVSGGRRRDTVRMTHTWPIVISVETEEVGVEGESRDGPWIVIAGRRAYRWKTGPFVVFGFEDSEDLQLAVSLLVMETKETEKRQSDGICTPDIYWSKSATDLGEDPRTKVLRALSTGSGKFERWVEFPRLPEWPETEGGSGGGEETRRDGLIATLVGK